jgi:hypothetical protein
MNVETGTEAAQFPEKEYINGIFVAVQPIYGERYKKLKILQSGLSVVTLVLYLVMHCKKTDKNVIDMEVLRLYI